MSKSFQSLSRQGSLKQVPPGVRIRIDPELCTARGEILVPDEVDLFGPFDLVGVVNDPVDDLGHGTFDVQNTSSEPADLRWSAAHTKTLHKKPMRTEQEGVGKRGANPSPHVACAVDGLRIVNPDKEHTLASWEAHRTLVLISQDAPITLPPEPLTGSYFTAKNISDKPVTMGGGGKNIRQQQNKILPALTLLPGESATLAFTGTLWDVIQAGESLTHQPSAT